MKITGFRRLENGDAKAKPSTRKDATSKASGTRKTARSSKKR